MTTGGGDWRDERNEDGFPVANEDRDGEFFVDVVDGKDVVYQCRFVEGLGWCWVNIRSIGW